MSYKHQLSPWCIIRHQQNLQNLIVARFRRRSDEVLHICNFSSASSQRYPSASFST